MNIAERVEYWARWRPEETAIRTPQEELDWRELGSRVARVARGLADRGIDEGDRVGILAMNGTQWCVLALAALHRGAIVVPLNIRMAAPELKQILDHSGCQVVAYDATFAELYAGAADGGERKLTVGLDGEAGADIEFDALLGADSMDVVERGERTPAIIGYTSGTTGLPKGVILSHRNLAALGLQTMLSESSTTERHTLLCIPLAFTGGIVNNFVSTVVAGGSLTIEPAFDPERVLELLQRDRITTLFAVPIMWQAIAGVDGFADADLSALSSAITGGAPVPRKLLDAYHAKDVVIRQAYGLTEATGSVAMPTRKQALETPAAAGQPNVHTRLRIVDAEGGNCPVGEVGEIYVKGPSVMEGYWEDDEATAESIDSDGWLHTGDMASMTDDGMLQIADRKKAMFISGGLNVYPAEIERTVDSHPGVAESCAFGLEHERFGEACAIILRPADGELDTDQVVAHCREQLSDYKVPRAVFVTEEELPRGMSGKILRDEVRKVVDALGEPVLTR